MDYAADRLDVLEREEWASAFACPHASLGRVGSRIVREGRHFGVTRV